eukprot:142369-Ditylum_brightwellii.AAC.1
MVHGCGHDPQLASRRVPFTYGVKWTENKELHWASCWDVYLSMENSIPDKNHWLIIANTIIVAILVPNLRCDFHHYNRLVTDEEKVDDLEDFRWKIVHAQT